MNCPSCGARLMSGENECPYCGSPVEQPRASSPETSHDFGPLLKSRDLQELLMYTPSSVRARAGQAFLMIFGLVFTSFAIFFIVMAKRSGAPLIFRLFPMIFVLVGAGMLIGGLRGLVKLATSPLERLPAVIVGKRQQYDTDSRGSGSTSYYVTIQTEDGERKEHLVQGRLYGEVQRGDAGVAYLKGGFLLDFRPVRMTKS
jgi:hypothetical protein